VEIDHDKPTAAARMTRRGGIERRGTLLFSRILGASYHKEKRESKIVSIGDFFIRTKMNWAASRK
jgi:hypothetical protein